MGKIRDIRLFEADWPNEDYQSIPQYIGKIFQYDSMDALDVIDRLLFLLRSREFGFEGFDHLYLNYTPLLPHGQIQRAERTTCREDAWLRWVDVGCNAEMFNSWEFARKREYILSTIKEAVLFLSGQESRELAENSIREVLEQGAQLRIPYKRKQREEYTLNVLVKITDDLDFIPVVVITAQNGTVLYEQEWKPYVRDAFICQFSSFSLGKRSLRITPRKNFESEFYELEPIKITW